MPRLLVCRLELVLIATAAIALGCGQRGAPGVEAAAAGATLGSVGGAVGASGADAGGSPGTAAGGGAGSHGGSAAVGGEPGLVISPQGCTINAPTHWASGIHVVNCKIDVESSLTLDPGAIIKFGPGFYLDVHPGATLTAIGNDSLPILFTSLADDAHGGDTNGDGASLAAANDWGCQGSCGDLNIRGKGCVLDHVSVLYGSNGVYIQAESTQIRKSTFAHQGTYGLVLDGHFPVDTTQLSENAFFDNGGYPLHLGKPTFLDASNVFHDPENPDRKNGKQCIELDTDLDQLVVLGVTELGFLFSGRRISAEVLTPPGVIFKAQDAAIHLDESGSLYNGPNAIFTSFEDDSLGGDCTGDGPIMPVAGDWEGLAIDDGTKVDYAAPADYIRYAAKSGTGLVH